MIIRKYRPSDINEIYQLFYDTVHSINLGDYTEEQVNAWADGNMDENRWNRSFLEHKTFVAVIDDTIVGFGDIENTGHLDRLYVHKDFQHRGIATAICDKLETVFDTDTVFTEASITAKPFFEKRGYRVIYEQQVERHGVKMTNYRMSKILI
ncbi:MAG: GNAT family N-acetyltransferase [Clostridia bacterium]|nr:GNAT family N-acetyltransferase [Clostridia bacterium]